MPTQEITKKDRNNACGPFIFSTILIPLITLSAAKFGGYDPIALITKQEEATFYFYTEFNARTKKAKDIDKLQQKLAKLSPEIGNFVGEARRSVNPRYKFYYEDFELDFEFETILGSIDTEKEKYDEVIKELMNEQQLGRFKKLKLGSALYGAILIDYGTIVCIGLFGLSLIWFIFGKSGKCFVILIFVIKAITVAVPIAMKLAPETKIRNCMIGNWCILDCCVVVICLFLMLCKWK